MLKFQKREKEDLSLLSLRFSREVPVKRSTPYQPIIMSGEKEAGGWCTKLHSLPLLAAILIKTLLTDKMVKIFFIKNLYDKKGDTNPRITR